MPAIIQPVSSLHCNDEYQSSRVSALSSPSFWPCHYPLMQRFYLQLVHFPPNYFIYVSLFLFSVKNNVPVLSHAYTFFSWLSFCFKASTWTADKESLPKGQWPEHFFSRTAITICQRHTKLNDLRDVSLGRGSFLSLIANPSV